jgi:hypothetical protein
MVLTAWLSAAPPATVPLDSRFSVKERALKIYGSADKLDAVSAAVAALSDGESCCAPGVRADRGAAAVFRMVVETAARRVRSPSPARAARGASPAAAAGTEADTEGEPGAAGTDGARRKPLYRIKAEQQRMARLAQELQAKQKVGPPLEDETRRD